MPTGLAAALAVYGIVLVVALGVGMSRTSESSQAAPIGALGQLADAGANPGPLLMAAPVAAIACPECDGEAMTANGATALSHLAWKPSLFINSTAAHVFDESCGQTLWSKNEHMRLPPASLTKMMTALVVTEQAHDLNTSVAVNISASELAARTNSSVMGLERGMEVSLYDLLFGLMLPSGNDAAIVLAEAIAGDVDAFVALMNTKAEALGLTDTRFANPHGLDNADQVSSAHDLTVMGKAVMANPVLAEVVRAASYTVAGGLGMSNGNRMLKNYDGTYGVKIGYTRRAFHTITVAAERDGRHIYASVLGSKTPYVDAATLLDWAFSQTQRSC